MKNPFKKDDKKKKNQKPEIFVSLTANGTPVQAINFELTHTNEGEPVLNVRTKDVCEPLHFSEIDFDLKTNLKQVQVKATFREAKNEKKFKLYVFNVLDVKQFFI